MRRVMVTVFVLAFGSPCTGQDAAPLWKKHVVYQGARCNTAVAGDFSGDGRVDIICNAGNVTRLLVAPAWTEVILDAESKRGLIHSEVMDADGDGDLDFIGARYKPGLIFWLEQPDKPLQQRWTAHPIDEQVDGIHGLLVGDVDVDGKPELLANSAQPQGPFANSLVWYRRPAAAKADQLWPRFVLAQGDAPGLSHYLGLGDVDGDGRPDACSGAKGGPQDKSGLGEWFAWWKAPADPRGVWKKEVIAAMQPGATNIHPADVNGDGKTDFVASRGHGQGVVWFEAPTWREHDIDKTLACPHCLQVVDLDGDGDLDAATCAYESRIVAWFENDGKGNFTTHVVGTDQAAYDIRVVDLDGDKDIDLLIAGQQSENVVWYENPAR